MLAFIRIGPLPYTADSFTDCPIFLHNPILDSAANPFNQFDLQTISTQGRMAQPLLKIPVPILRICLQRFSSNLPAGRREESVFTITESAHQGLPASKPDIQNPCGDLDGNYGKPH